MKIINQPLWDSQTGAFRMEYTRIVVDFAKRWAELMETRIAAGEKLADIAKQTADEADTEDISGMAYSVAVMLMVGSWVYGKDLFVWHQANR